VSVEDAVAAIRAGRLVLLPTDTVYGLACAPEPEPVRALSELKGRPPSQPIALLAAEVDGLLECVPELRGRPATLARALLPGPYTLVLPNPAQRFPWLAGSRPDTIGVRVVELAPAARAVVDRVGVLAATSANRTGEPDARRLADVPEEIRAACGAEIDAGELPGTPSTVLDLTGPEPRVLREGAVRAAEALAAVARASSSAAR
jgi:L-threonylcarbamoyladenylate synthase